MKNRSDSRVDVPARPESRLKRGWRWQPRSALTAVLLSVVVATIGIVAGHRLVFIIMQAVEIQMPFHGAFEVALTVVYAKIFGLWSPAFNVYAPMYILLICWLSPWKISRLGIAIVVVLALFNFTAPYPFIVHVPPGGTASLNGFVWVQSFVEVIGAPIAIWVLTRSWRLAGAVALAALLFRSVHHHFMYNPPFGNFASWPYQVLGYGYHVVLFGIMLSWLVAGIRLHRRRAARSGSCGRCGYEIAGLLEVGVAVCPECGEPITSAAPDQGTTATGPCFNVTSG